MEPRPLMKEEREVAAKMAVQSPGGIIDCLLAAEAYWREAMKRWLDEDE